MPRSSSIPRTPSDIASGILEATSSRDVLAHGVSKRVEQVTWKRCVATHVDLYRSLAADL